MEDIKIQVCRLCFNLISDKNFYPITGSLKHMLQVITTDMNLDITSYPVMCNECFNSVQDMFNFKTNCFESEEKIELRISHRDLKLDLTDIMNHSFNNRPKRKTAILKSIKYKLCRTCLKKIECENFIFLNKNADACLLLMLESCLSELNLMLTIDPVMCQSCYEILQKMSIFKSLCKQNECKIDVYLKIDGGYQKNVNLHSVLHFSSNADNCSNITEDCKIQNCLEYVKVKIEPNDEVVETKQRKIKKANNFLCQTKNKFVAIKIEKKMLAKSHEQIRQKHDKNYERKRITHCTDCDFKTKYKYNLRRHLIVTHHRKDIEIMKKFCQCPHCDFATRWNLDLTRHMLSHVKPEAFQCTRCPYSTNQNSHFVKHILSHVNAENINDYSFMQGTKKNKYSAG